MVNLLIDGDQSLTPKNEISSLERALEHVDTYLADNNRIITSLQIDGRTISPEELETGSVMSIENAATVEVSTESATAPSDKLLSAIEEQIPVLANTVRDLAAMFQEGRIEKGEGGRPEEGVTLLGEVLALGRTPWELRPQHVEEGSVVVALERLAPKGQEIAPSPLDAAGTGARETKPPEEVLAGQGPVRQQASLSAEADPL